MLLQYHAKQDYKVDLMMRCHDLLVLSYENNKIERVTKELLLLFSRDNLICNKLVRSTLFKLFLLLLLPTIPLVLVFVSFSVISSSMLVFKISKAPLSVNANFLFNILKISLKKLFQIL